MELTAEHLASFHQEIEKWKTDLIFCRDEIEILNRCLQDVSEKNDSSDMKGDIVHFQQRLVERREMAAALMNEIALYEKQPQSTVGHEDIKRKIADYCQSYTGLKSTFIRFLAKTGTII